MVNLHERGFLIYGLFLISITTSKLIIFCFLDGIILISIQNIKKKKKKKKYLLSKHVCRQDGSNEYPKSILYRACNEEFIGANVPKNIMLYHVRLMETTKKNQINKQQH